MNNIQMAQRQVIRLIGPTERHFLIVGHVIYAVIAGLIVFVSNCLLALMANFREWLAEVSNIPTHSRNQIDTNNEIFIKMSEADRKAAIEEDESEEGDDDEEAPKPTEKDE